MEPKKFKEVNANMLAGGNENCNDLLVCHSVDAEGFPVIVSCWKLNPEELERVKETGEVWLGIRGRTMPPVLPMAENPFEAYGYAPADVRPFDVGHTVKPVNPEHPMHKLKGRVRKFMKEQQIVVVDYGFWGDRYYTVSELRRVS